MSSAPTPSVPVLRLEPPIGHLRLRTRAEPPRPGASANGVCTWATSPPLAVTRCGRCTGGSKPEHCQRASDRGPPGCLPDSSMLSRTARKLTEQVALMSSSLVTDQRAGASDYAGYSDRGAGWLLFAGTMLGLAGIMRIIDSIWAFSYHGSLPDNLRD